MFKNSLKLFNQSLTRPLCSFANGPRSFRTSLRSNLPQCPTQNSLFQISSCNVQSVRFKGKGPKNQTKTDSESEVVDSDDFIDNFQDKNTKILKINVTSLRVDSILKSALGLARNKVETLFYESKIRVNGEKIFKKSISVQEGDEIDLLKGPDLKNPDFMNVARVEILKVVPNEENITLKIRRCKSLTVETYS